jgi:hypothetical protein
MTESKNIELLIEDVKKVIVEADEHLYSMSRIYKAYNTAFGKNERPQGCGSCLRNRVRELRTWLKKNEPEVTPEPEASEPEPPDTVRFPMPSGLAIDFTPFSEDDPSRGAVRYTDGGKVTPGRYESTNGSALVVQVGSKGRIEWENLL